MGCCCTLHVSVLAGQSNARGFGLPVQLTENSQLAESVPTILFSSQELSNTATLLHEIECEDLQTQNSDYFGPELSLARCLEIQRGPDWQCCDHVGIIKFAVGGSALNQWLMSDSSGVSAAFYKFLGSSIAQMSAKFCNIQLHDLYWVQGESDSQPLLASTYAARFSTFISELNSLYSFNPVFAQLNDNRGTANDPFAAQINADMIAAGYDVTVPNSDLTLVDAIHYDAESLIGLGKRLCFARN